MADPIREDDLVASIADALQYIAVYHPPSFVEALAERHAREESPAARDAIGQIRVNSRMAAFGRRPMCRDTGTVNVFVKLGMGARIASARPLDELVNVAVRLAYTNPDNPLRASIVRDPPFDRKSAGDNTPAVMHCESVPGDTVTITVAAAYLVSKAVKSARVLAFADLGMEAIHEFVVADMPVTVAVDATGASIHQTGPSQWRRPVVRRVFAEAGA